MEVKLLAFGIAKDILNQRSMPWTLDTGSTVADLKNALYAKYDDFGKLRSLRYAVNESYVNDEHVLQEQDEIVLIPPVSGG